MKNIFLLVAILHCWLFANGQTAELDINAEYKKGVEALNNYQYQKAVDIFFECNRSDYNNNDYLQKLAYAYMKLGDYGEAKLSYKSLLKRDSSIAKAWIDLGGIYEKELNYKKAGECYSNLLDIDSTNSFYFRQNAFIAKKRKNFIAAIAFFNKAHELNEKDMVVIVELSELLLRLQQAETALALVEKGLKHSPKNLKLLYSKASILNFQKNYEEVITTVQQTMAMGDTVQYYQKLIGLAFLKMEQYDSCIHHLTEIVIKEQASEHTYSQLAQAYSGLGELDSATVHYELAIDYGISKNVVNYYRNLAMTLDSQKKLKPAIDAWKKAIELEDEEEPQPIAYFFLAQDCDNYYKDKNIAIRYYQKYLKSGHQQYPDYVKKRISYLKGVMHQQRKKKKS